MDFKLQARLKEFGIIDEDENKALIGNEVVQGLDDINAVRKEVVQDIKDKKKEIKKEIRKEKEEIRKEKKELQEGIKKIFKPWEINLRNEEYIKDN